MFKNHRCQAERTYLDTILSSLPFCFLILISGCNSGEMEKLQNDNRKLKEKNIALEIENTQLKETADYHYKSGIDYLEKNKWKEAKTEFKTVIQKFPLSSLVANSKTGYDKAELNNIAEEKARNLAEANERRAKEAAERLSGTPIDYAIFYAKAKGGGLPIGKRFRIGACLNRDVTCICIKKGSNLDKLECALRKDFDNTEILESFIARPGDWDCGYITASMGGDGHIHIHGFN